MTTTMTKKAPPPIIFLLTGLSILTGYCALRPSKPQSETLGLESPIENRMSLGEKILIPAGRTIEKKRGAAAFAIGDYKRAIKDFNLSLWSNANDPETLIYRSNAAIGTTQSKTIAVSVPISSNLNVAQEILRGVAQVQWEINDSGRINRIPLKIKVIDDQNDPAIAQQVATALVKESHVSAVIGHNSSDASLEDIWKLLNMDSGQAT